MYREQKKHNRKKGNSLRMEKHMDILQACVMVPLPTPTWPMTSACFLSAEEKGRRQRVNLNCEVGGFFFLFTQRATASHEASGPQRSRLTGSSSQTKSEEETAEYTVHMTSCCPCTEHTDSVFRLGGSVVLLLEAFIQERPESLLHPICLLISQRRLNHERKL